MPRKRASPLQAKTGIGDDTAKTPASRPVAQVELSIRRATSPAVGGGGQSIHGARINRSRLEWQFGLEGKMAGRRAEYPDRRISETLLDFAGITPYDLPSEAAERRAREALTVACTVWNAVIFADVLKDHRHLDEVRRLIGASPEGAVHVEQLITRKRTLFSGDERLIGGFEVTRTEDGIHVHAEARDPYTLPPNRA